jgi:hypothetical protein
VSVTVAFAHIVQAARLLEEYTGPPITKIEDIGANPHHNISQINSNIRKTLKLAIDRDTILGAG